MDLISSDNDESILENCEDIELRCYPERNAMPSCISHHVKHMHSTYPHPRPPFCH